ncbi:MAG: fumarylacetoacetase [Bacteroidia bacterium]
MIKANDPALKSWLPVSPESDFPIQNLPFGIFKREGKLPRAGIAIGDYVVDLAEAALHGYMKDLNVNLQIFENQFLNPVIGMGKEKCRLLRQIVSDMLNVENPELRDRPDQQKRIIHKLSDVTLQIPVRIGDYTDFYSSIDHATNVGKMFRDPANALLPNWKHLPVGYHGRSSSICVSGHSFHRPKGQTKAADAELPSFGPTKALDFELEMGFIIGRSTNMGDSVSTGEADDFIFGMTLFNDWSARDIQTWEYVPLGPFLAKNFASTLSPWIVTLDALEPFRTEGYKQGPAVLPYLQYYGNKNIDIPLEVSIIPENSSDETVVSRSNYKYMYWTMEQQLAHHTVNGCNINVGDLMASGTISGPDPTSFGSMLELTWRGSNPLKLKNGSERKFINDGDTVVIRGRAEKDGICIGFGECRATVLPAK